MKRPPSRPPVVVTKRSRSPAPSPAAPRRPTDTKIRTWNADAPKVEQKPQLTESEERLVARFYYRHRGQPRLDHADPARRVWPANLEGQQPRGVGRVLRKARCPGRRELYETRRLLERSIALARLTLSALTEVPAITTGHGRWKHIAVAPLVRAASLHARSPPCIAEQLGWLTTRERG